MLGHDPPPSCNESYDPEEAPGKASNIVSRVCDKIIKSPCPCQDVKYSLYTKVADNIIKIFSLDTPVFKNLIEVSHVRSTRSPMALVYTGRYDPFYSQYVGGIMEMNNLANSFEPGM